MTRIIYLAVFFVILLSLGACGKKEEAPEIVEVGNGGNQIDLDSINMPGGEAESEEAVMEIGKEKSDTIVIVIDWDKIVISDSECSNVEEMRDKIVKSGCKKIDLQHTDASKETFDEVVAVLKEIEETLEIDINYN